jgi:hypothetical protein
MAEEHKEMTQKQNPIDGIADKSPEGMQKLQTKYVSIVANMNWYGCTLFPCFQNHFSDFPTSVLVGIESGGVSVWTEEPLKRRKTFELANIYRWGYEPGRHFYIEVNEKLENGAMVLFRLSNAPEVSSLLQDYAMALLDEDEEDDEIKSDGEFEVAESKKAEPTKSALSQSKPQLRTKKKVINEVALVIHIQAVVRRFLVTNALHRENEEWSATLIQATFRGWIVRAEMESAHLDYAVSKLQAIHRGNKTRQDLFGNLGEEDAETIESETGNGPSSPPPPPPSSSSSSSSSSSGASEVKSGDI